MGIGAEADFRHTFSAEPTASGFFVAEENFPAWLQSPTAYGLVMHLIEGGQFIHGGELPCLRSRAMGASTSTRYPARKLLANACLLRKEPLKFPQLELIVCEGGRQRSGGLTDAMDEAPGRGVLRELGVHAVADLSPDGIDVERAQ